MADSYSERIHSALDLLDRGREHCSVIRKVFLLVERIRREGVFDARRRGRSVQTAPALKAQYEELARRVRRHRSACRTCHSYLTRFSGKPRKEIPIFLPGET